MNLEEVVIQSPRLQIIPLSEKYAENIFQEFKEAITYYMYPKPHQTIADTVRFIEKSLAERQAGTRLQMVILNHQTGEFLGMCGIHRLDKKMPELGLWIKESAQGQGYGKEAMVAVKAWADQNLEFEFIRYPVAKENSNSRKIAEFLGGKIAKEYNKTMQTGRTWAMVQYWIPKK